MKLTDKIHLLQIDFKVTLGPDKIIPRFVNIIMILGDKVTLIDTGVKGSEDLIFEYLKEQGRDYSEIETVILSHAHPDHIGSAAAIKELTNCRIIAHRREQEWIENIGVQAKERPVPGFFNLVDKPVKIDEFIEGNNNIRIEDGLTLKFIKSSGHSKGSLNIHFIEDNILFTADSIPLKNDIPNYDNFIELMLSLKEIKNNNDYNLLLTSWTPPLRSKDEIRTIIEEGETYMKKIDLVVKDCYRLDDSNSLENCKLAVAKLNLPPFLVNPIVDKAFKSHLNPKK